MREDMGDAWQDPIWDGWAAGIRGDDPRSCPYEPMTDEWRAWQRWHGFAIEYAKMGAADRE